MEKFGELELMEDTKVTFSTDVTIDGNTLEKGTYAIYHNTKCKKLGMYILYTEHTGNGDSTRMGLS